MGSAALRGARGAWTGFAAPFRGAWTIATRPGLWPLAAVPTVLLGAFLALGGAGARPLYHHIARAVSDALGASAIAGAGAAVARVLIAVLLAVVLLVLAAIIVPAISAPFMDALAGKVDRRPSAEEPLGKQVARSLRVAAFSVLLAGAPQLAFWALSFAVSWLAPLWLALGVAAAALGLAFDALDWPLSRRGLDAGARVDWMRNHAAATAGLGAAVWLMFWVPGLSIVLLPATVVGAVDLVDRAEA